MKRGLLTFLIVLAVAFVAYAGLAVQREANVGTGPMVTDPAPQGATRDIAFVANAVGGTVSLIDLDQLAVIGEIDVLQDGKTVGLFRDPIQAIVGQRIMERNGLNYAQDTDVSPDGRVLYVARGHLGDVAAFDIATGELMWRLPVGGFRADHMAISKDGMRLFVSALTFNQVETIDITTGEKDGSFITGAFPHDNHISNDGARIYNASLGNMILDLDERDNVDRATDRKGFAYQITVAETGSLNVLDRHRFPAGIRPFAVTQDETRLYAQLSNTHAVVDYDLEARLIVNRVDLPVDDGVTEEDWDFEAPHHGLVMSPDETRLCIAGRASDYAALLSTETLEPLAIIDTGDAPSWSTNSPDGDLCLIANTRSDDVSVISYAEQREVARIDVGRGAKHITAARVPETVLAGYGE